MKTKSKMIIISTLLLTTITSHGDINDYEEFINELEL